MTIGTETESKEVNLAGYGEVTPVTSVEKTYNINWSKIAKQAVEGYVNQIVSNAKQAASDFQKTASAISSNDINTAATEVGEGLLATTVVVGLIVLLSLLLA